MIVDTIRQQRTVAHMARGRHARTPKLPWYHPSRLHGSDLLLIAAGGVSLILVGNLLTQGQVSSSQLTGRAGSYATDTATPVSASPLAETQAHTNSAAQTRSGPAWAQNPRPTPVGTQAAEQNTAAGDNLQESARAGQAADTVDNQAPSISQVQPSPSTEEPPVNPEPQPPVQPEPEAYSGPVNILVILTDDQRAGTEQAMPTVVRELIGKGTYYPNAVVPTSWCCPSRASLLTGQYAHNTGVWDNSDSVPYGAWQSFKGKGENNTIAVALDKAGYRTGLFGKYLNGMEKAPINYAPPGWDKFLALAGSGNGYTEFPLTDGRRITDTYSTDFFAQETEKFIRETPPSQPLFAMFTPFAPHSPFIAGPYKGTSKPHIEKAKTAARWPGPTVNEKDVSDRPKWVSKLPTNDLFDPRRTSLTIEEAITAQHDTLMGVDAAVKRLLGALNDTGRLENTLIVYASDNGYSWGEHRTRGKNTPYDASIRVPLITRWDARDAGPSVEPRITAANIDVTATILDATKTNLPRTDGRSMYSAAGRDGVLLEATRWRGERDRPAYCGWRTNDAMWVRYATGEEELYDYRIDPYEQTNKAQDPAYRDLRQTYLNKARNGCRPLPPMFSWS